MTGVDGAGVVHAAATATIVNDSTKATNIVITFFIG
jgi:hypothetical protein